MEEIGRVDELLPELEGDAGEADPAEDLAQALRRRRVRTGDGQLSERGASGWNVSKQERASLQPCE